MAAGKTCLCMSPLLNGPGSRHWRKGNTSSLTWSRAGKDSRRRGFAWSRSGRKPAVTGGTTAPIATTRPEVLPHYAADIDDDAVRILLNDLATEIGGILEQEEVHVAYRDRTWTLKAGTT